MKAIVAIVAMFLAACSAAPRTPTLKAQHVDQIQVSNRRWFAVCIGACSEFDLTVTAAGDVVSRSWSSDRRKSTIYRYRITPEQFARFDQILRPLKAQASSAAPRVCTHPEVVGAERDLILPKVIPWKIRWQNYTTAELRDCGGIRSAPVAETLRRALREIRLWPSGDVICHLPSGEESLCTFPDVVDAPHMEGWGLECAAADEPPGNGPSLQALPCRLRKLDEFLAR